MDPSVPAAMRASQVWEDRVMTAFRRASIERLRRELPQVVIKQFPNTAHISILVLEQNAVAAAIREFLRQVGKTGLVEQ